MTEPNILHSDPKVFTIDNLMKAYIITIIKNSDSLDYAETCLKSC